MSSIWDTVFVVVDVETTGSDPDKNRITEIACVKLQGGEIISEFSSLVNPHQFIPAFIANMTGISNEMAFKAPEAEHVLPKAADFFKAHKTVFVAHNANFDWSFIQKSFIRAGITPLETPRLCTLKLARRVLDKSMKKNVGALADFFSVPIFDRHRAYGDAKATAFILLELLEILEQEHNVTTMEELIAFQNRTVKHYNPVAKVLEKVEDKLDGLPAEPGVYYFTDKNDNILYIGKAKVLKDRVRSYFRNGSLMSRKIADLVKRIHDIKWNSTGSELSALLLESKEIKQHQPPFNVVAKKYRNYPFIKLRTDNDYPVLEKCYEIADDKCEYFGPFRSGYLVDEILNSVDKKFKIRKCDDKLHPDPKNKPCFYFHIERCGAPCSLKQTKDEYAEEIRKVRFFLGGFTDGIINQLETKMLDFADTMNFEKAALVRNQIFELRKIFERQKLVPASINSNNLIIILPGSEREKTVEVLFIHAGKLADHKTIGRKAPLNSIKNFIHETYYNGNNGSRFQYTQADIDELRIINSWLYKQRDTGRYIYIEGRIKDDILNEFEHEVRNMRY